ncbi:MAG: hypothetical protein C4308_13500 [Chitinophagaceae bacterium]
MKPIYCLLTSLFVNLLCFAQDCKGYYYLTNGEVQLTIFDKKGKESGKLTYTISNSTKTGSVFTADFGSVFVNEKGKVLSEGKGKIKCTGSVLMVDARMSIPQEQLTAFKDMDVKTTESFIEYPAKIKEGDKLKDVNFTMEVYNKGNLFSTVNFNEVNRQVIGKETITTPAGNWECFKISYESTSKSQMGPIGITMNLKITEWFAPGFGVVKSETYNKKNKLMASSIISSVKK